MSLQNLLADQNINKVLAVSMLVALLAVTVVFGLARLPLPPEVSTLFGAIVGFVAHALGVNSGAATTATATVAAANAAATVASAATGNGHGTTTQPDNAPTAQI